MWQTRCPTRFLYLLHAFIVAIGERIRHPGISGILWTLYFMSFCLLARILVICYFLVVYYSVTGRTFYLLTRSVSAGCTSSEGWFNYVTARLQSVQVTIVQQISAIDAAVRFLHCCLSAVMSFSVIRCLPAIYPHFVTPARRRSYSVQSIQLLFSRPLDLFPVGYHWCTLLVSLPSLIRNTCPSHFNHICLILTDTGSLPALRSVTLNLANKFSQCTFSVTERYDLFSDLIIVRHAWWRRSYDDIPHRPNRTDRETAAWRAQRYHSDLKLIYMLPIMPYATSRQFRFDDHFKSVRNNYRSRL